LSESGKIFRAVHAANENYRWSPLLFSWLRLTIF
jgi:hypothetical protein